jgi:hypothetical protein
MPRPRSHRLALQLRSWTKRPLSHSASINAWPISAANRSGIFDLNDVQVICFHGSIIAENFTGAFHESTIGSGSNYNRNDDIKTIYLQTPAIVWEPQKSERKFVDTRALCSALPAIADECCRRHIFLYCKHRSSGPRSETTITGK